MPIGLAQALNPLLDQIAGMTLRIKQHDRQIQEVGQTEYPETQALQKVHGVGPITALTFVLTLGSKERFRQSRDVGCYLGLKPNATSRQTMIRICALPRPATPTSEVSWSSVPTTSFDRTDETRHFDSRAFTWLSRRQASQKQGRSCSGS